MICDALPKHVVRAPVESLEQIEMAIQLYNPKNVLVQSVWISDEEMRRLSARYPHIHFFIHIHSNIPFLACEAYSFARFNEAKAHGWKLVFNDHRAARCFPDSIYLPNIYSKEFIQHSPKPESEELNVICAGSLRPMKNHVTQALAAIMYAGDIGKKLKFHCNLTRSEGGEGVHAALVGLFNAHPEHELVSVPWLDHDEFIKYCSTMDFGLQVSMSESFNIVAADYAAAGLPMVVSDEVDWAPKEVQAKSGKAVNIAATMNIADMHVGDNRAALLSHNHYAMMAWEYFHGF